MKMTIDQHRLFAEQTKRYREVLLKTISVGTKSSREARAVQKALRGVDHLKNVMDSLVCRDFPEVEDAHRIYYGPSETYWVG